MFFVVFHAFRNLGYIPHPKPPFSQQVPLPCWWLSGVFPHILLILEHKIGCFVVISMVFHCKSRCGCILYIYHIVYLSFLHYIIHEIPVLIYLLILSTTDEYSCLWQKGHFWVFIFSLKNRKKQNKIKNFKFDKAFQTAILKSTGLLGVT